MKTEHVSAWGPRLGPPASEGRAFNHSLHCQVGGWASECAHTQAVRKEGGRSPAGSPRGAALRLGPAGARLGSARLGSAELQRGSEAGESQALPQDEEQGPSGSLFSCTTAFCHRVLIYFFSNTKITKTHDLPCLCLPTPGCILQGVFDSVFNHSPGGASRPVRWPGGGGGGGGVWVARRGSREGAHLQARK